MTLQAAFPAQAPRPPSTGRRNGATKDRMTLILAVLLAVFVSGAIINALPRLGFDTPPNSASIDIWHGNSASLDAIDQAPGTVRTR